MVETTGTVKWYKEELGYGFITPDDGGADVLIHVSVLDVNHPILQVGQKMSFSKSDDGPKGPQVIRVFSVDPL